MNEIEMYLAAREREFRTTLKVLGNYPEDKLDLKPHEKLRSAGQLAFVFAAEEFISKMIAEGNLDWRKVMGGTVPDTLPGIIAEARKRHEETTKTIQSQSEEELHKPIDFGGAPMRRLDALWAMLFDHIHHRGQFSVYLRMAGGKVPSIYGPTADEPIQA